jgi:hypothetical protein
LNEKAAAPVKKTELTTAGIRCADDATPSISKKLALTAPSGGRSVGIKSCYFLKIFPLLELYVYKLSAV